MNTKYLLLTTVLLLSLAACSQTGKNTAEQPQQETTNKTQLEQDIKALENKLKQQISNKLDKATASELIEKSEAFVKAFPKDANSPALLFRAADVARGIGKYGQAIKLWGTVYHDYPDYERTPDAQFLIGFTYENNLNEKTQAKKYYNNFLNKYPDHSLAEQVRQTLSVIDKSPEELIKEFQQKNKERKE